MGEGSLPKALLDAFEHQLINYPDDDLVLNRLYYYLTTTQPMLVEIKDAVCEFYCVQPCDLVSNTREREIAFARFVFCYFAHKYTRQSLTQVGRFVGLRHHTTVMYGIRDIEKRALTQPLVRDDLDLLHIRISEKMMRRRMAHA